MRLFIPFLLLAWCPSSVLGGYAVVVQTGGGVMKPGDVLNYVVSADPVPSWTLGMVLIGTVPDATGGAICWPWTITLTSSPKQASIRIPSGVPPKLYTVDIHVNASIYSTKLATSNVFEVVSDAPPTTQAPPTTNVVHTTKQTTIVTTQQTVVQQPPNSPQPQPDPTSQNPVVTDRPVTTQNSPSNAANSPSSNAPPSSNTGSTMSQSGSTDPILMPSAQSATGVTTNPSPSPSADSSLGIPPDTTEKKKSSPIGPAIGGAIGGIIVILLLLFLWRRHNKKKEQRIAIDEMAESNSRFTDRPTTPATSPFANTFREFQPNRSNTAVSPFLLDSERSPPPTSPDPTVSSKYREAFGQKHHQNTSIGASSASASGSGGASEQLRGERERALGEISALRSRGGQGSGSAYAQSSVSAGSSGGRDVADEEIRNRLDMLTQHVARLENALGQGAYEAPPTYHQAPSEAASQRG